MLVNGRFGGGTLGGLCGILLADAAAKWAMGRAAPDPWFAAGSVVGITAGGLAGIAASVWVFGRLKGRGVDIVLLTLAFVPVVGPVVGLVHTAVGAAMLARRWRNPARRTERRHAG